MPNLLRPTPNINITTIIKPVFKGYIMELRRSGDGAELGTTSEMPR